MLSLIHILHPEQRKVLQLIGKNRGLIFSAPTSFGKTFVVFEYICRARPQNVVMVVPTLALIDEYKQKIIKQYRNKFDDYNIYLSIAVSYTHLDVYKRQQIGLADLPHLGKYGFIHSFFLDGMTGPDLSLIHISMCIRDSTGARGA